MFWRGAAENPSVVRKVFAGKKSIAVVDGAETEVKIRGHDPGALAYLLGIRIDALFPDQLTRITFVKEDTEWRVRDLKRDER